MCTPRGVPFGFATEGPVAAPWGIPGKQQTHTFWEAWTCILRPQNTSNMTLFRREAWPGALYLSPSSNHEQLGAAVPGEAHSQGRFSRRAGKRGNALGKRIAHQLGHCRAIQRGQESPCLAGTRRLELSSCAPGLWPVVPVDLSAQRASRAARLELIWPRHEPELPTSPPPSQPDAVALQYSLCTSLFDTTGSRAAQRLHLKGSEAPTAH